MWSCFLLACHPCNLYGICTENTCVLFTLGTRQISCYFCSSCPTSRAALTDVKRGLQVHIQHVPLPRKFAQRETVSSRIWIWLNEFIFSMIRPPSESIESMVDISIKYINISWSGLLKYQYSCLSSYFCFQVFVVALFVLMLSVLLLATVISLSLIFLI